MNRILAVRGQVVPVSPTPLTLHARLKDGSVSMVSRSDADAGASIASGLTPDEVRPSDDALAAIADAELIVLGPGSLFTSLLPSLLIPAIRDASARAGAAHLRLQRGHPGGRDHRLRPRRHVEALVATRAPSLVDIVPRQQPLSTRRPRIAAGTVARRRSPALATDVDPSRGSSSTTSSTRRRPPPRPGRLRRRDHPRARGRAGIRAGDSRPDARAHGLT
jgi:hypothetical protein